jgi:outer membrane protein
MKDKRIDICFLLVVCLFYQSSHAESLSYLLELAVSNEPTYLSAMSTVQAANARTDQAFGGLLPQVDVSANTNYNTRDFRFRSTSNSPQQDTYNSNAQQLNITQPIWSGPSYLGLQQAKAAASQAEQQLADAEQELLAKVVSAWFELLAARDQVQFTQQQIELAEFWQKVAQRSFELGSMGQPELDEAKAKLAQANAEKMAAESDVSLKRAALEQVVGTLGQLTLTYMRTGVALANIINGSIDDVVTRVETGNHQILAAKHAYKAAMDEVHKQSAGHQPTLDLVASYGRNSQSVGGFAGQDGYDVIEGSIGLQLKIPLYSGGAQSAKVAEAIALKENARLDIEVARRESILAAKQAWYGWHSVFTKASASEQAIKAANTALHAATVSANNGLESELAVLEAQQKLSEAQRDYNKSRYDQVVNFVKLKAVLGVLTVQDITALDSLFEGKPTNVNVSGPVKVTEGLVGQ